MLLWPWYQYILIAISFYVGLQCPFATPPKTSGHGVVGLHTSCKQRWGRSYVCRGGSGFESQVVAFIVCRAGRVGCMATNPSILAGGWEQHLKKGVALHCHKIWICRGLSIKHNPAKHVSTFYQLFINFLSTFYQLFINLLSTNILSTCYQLFINFF